MTIPLRKSPIRFINCSTLASPCLPYTQLRYLYLFPKPSLDPFILYTYNKGIQKYLSLTLTRDSHALYQ